jgi:FkbM family methyltransferase
MKLPSAFKSLYNRLVHLASLAPYFPPIPLDRRRLINMRSAGNTIRLIEELGIVPGTIVDAGANDSQWAYWITRRYPSARLISFEPNPNHHPMGEVQRIALGNRSESGNLFLAGESSRLLSSAATGTCAVQVRRFDELALQFERPAILKIDCENKTAEALEGFGDRIGEFSVVVAEMCNDSECWPDHEEYQSQPAQILRHMLGRGFDTRIVDVGYDFGRISLYDMAFFRRAK